MAMLDEGTRTRTSIGISDELAALGANLSAGSGLDMSGVTLEALKDKLDPSLAVFADVVLNPSFPRTDFERLKRQRLAQIQQEKADPVGMALRVFPTLLYGQGHAYANPWTGSGTEESVGKITRDDLVKFHRTWFKPNNATLIVVGRHHDGGDPAQAGARLRRLDARATCPRRTSAPSRSSRARRCTSSIGRRRFSRSFWSATSHRRRPIPTSPRSRP